jgi:hypothetical protein
VTILGIDDGNHRPTLQEPSGNVEQLARGAVHLDDASAGVEPYGGHRPR